MAYGNILVFAARQQSAIGIQQTKANPYGFVEKAITLCKTAYTASRKINGFMQLLVCLIFLNTDAAL